MIIGTDSKNQTLIFESIRVKDRELQHIEYHNLRLNRSRKDLFHCQDEINLEEIIIIPSDLKAGVYKCRVISALKDESIEFIKYTPRRVRNLKMVESNYLNYRHKYLDRSEINDLFMQRGDCDDILIIKNGLITDTSYANVVFWNGKAWFTPSNPLLNGTARQRLLRNNRIAEAELKPKDLSNFLGCKLVNAMLDFDDPSNQLIKVNEIL